MPAVIEFTLQAKPGHYDEVKDKYIAFADAFVQGQPEEEFALITGDAASGTIRGIGVFDSWQAGADANSLASFAAFMDSIEDLITGPPTRTEMDLVHVYVRR
ncbi:MAG: hypothetical protein KGQ95_00630 [Acidobacteria bacterium]|jgi:quinol monooxygenase YgiN|nr:hypothetical protein [Acidobacteriota bacterium]